MLMIEPLDRLNHPGTSRTTDRYAAEAEIRKFHLDVSFRPITVIQIQANKSIGCRRQMPMLMVNVRKMRVFMRQCFMAMPVLVWL